MTGPVVVGSDTSGVPLSWALEWCSSTGDELVVASALHPDQAEMPPDWHDELIASARSDLEARIGVLEGSSPPAHRSLILDGDPSDIITQVADDEAASLVVIGARGDGGFHSLGLGGVAHHLSHHLHRPLVIVPHAGGPLQGGTIVVGIDGSDESTTAAKWAVDAARRVGGSVHTVYAYDPAADSYGHGDVVNRKERGEVDARAQAHALEGQGVKIEITVIGAHPVEALIDVGNQVNASLIVSGTKGQGGFHGMVLGRVPAQLPHHAGRPVALIHHDG
ncbi:MAG: universal stress protein [Aquihabitans sp.]